MVLSDLYITKSDGSLTSTIAENSPDILIQKRNQ